MIRKSAYVAVAAILISLMVHVFGLSLTAPNLANPQVEGSVTDTVALGNSFEDLAEALPEPVEPEPAEVPEPPAETPPEPERAEIPTSKALVASPDPQRTRSPDTGTGPITQDEPPEPEVNQPVGQSEAEASASDERTTTPPVEPDTVAESPQSPPDTSTSPVDTPTAEEAASPEPEQLAALPEPEAATVPVIPLESEAVDPEISVEEAEAEPEESAQAVTASIRPRLLERGPPAEPPVSLNNFRNFDNLQFPEETIESPLDVYQREGLDAFTARRSGNRSGGRGPGNADTTNYVGRVLVHLNRTPPVYVKTRGYAQVFFQIDPDGTLAWVDIIRSSGSTDVELAAKEQVRAAEPFPRPPGGVSRKLSFYYQND